MRATPVAKAATGGVVRRGVQTAVIAMVLLMATAVCVLAAALGVDSHGPFDKAFTVPGGRLDPIIRR